MPYAATNVATNLMFFPSTARRRGTDSPSNTAGFGGPASANTTAHASTSRNFVRGLLIGLLLSIGLFWLPLGALVTYLILS
jgi:hypothetical protein